MRNMSSEKKELDFPILFHKNKKVRSIVVIAKDKIKKED